MSMYVILLAYIVSLNLMGLFVYSELLGLLAESLKKLMWYLELLQGNYLCVVGSWFYLFLKWLAVVSTLDFITKMYLLIAVKQEATLRRILYWDFMLFLKFLWVCRVVVNQVTVSFQTSYLLWTVEVVSKDEKLWFCFS